MWECIPKNVYKTTLRAEGSMLLEMYKKLVLFILKQH